MSECRPALTVLPIPPTSLSTFQRGSASVIVPLCPKVQVWEKLFSADRSQCRILRFMFETQESVRHSLRSRTKQAGRRPIHTSPTDNTFFYLCLYAPKNTPSNRQTQRFARRRTVRPAPRERGSMHREHTQGDLKACHVPREHCSSTEGEHATNQVQ